MEAGRDISESEPAALLVNLHSRRARQDPAFVENLERAFGERGPLILSRSPGELPGAMADLSRARPAMLFIAGGDGTLRQTLTHLIAAYGEQPLPKIAILRGGTMNTVATSLGICREPVDQLKWLLERQRKEKPPVTVRRRMLEVNRNYGFIFALGGFSRFIEHYQAHNPTPFFAFRLLSRTILSMIGKGAFASSFFEEFKASVWKDEKPWLSDTTLTNLSASAIRHIGFHFKPYYGAGENGMLGVLAFRDLPRRLLLHLPQIFFGRPVNDPSFLQVPARTLLIHVQTPMRPMLDGDILKADTSFDVRTGPELEMVVG
jgi:diacylglycerol kinase family enzyme